MDQVREHWTPQSLTGFIFVGNNRVMCVIAALDERSVSDHYL